LILSLCEGIKDDSADESAFSKTAKKNIATYRLMQLFNETYKIKIKRTVHCSAESLRGFIVSFPESKNALC
jgi:hypothetical protein